MRAHALAPSHKHVVRIMVQLHRRAVHLLGVSFTVHGLPDDEVEARAWLEAFAARLQETVRTWTSEVADASA
jgi:hypothetical protein